MFYSDCIKDFTKTCITQSFILVLYNFEIVYMKDLEFYKDDSQEEEVEIVECTHM